ncbi:MAG TPA: hypothetical protein V6D25_08260 [Leptolyngbyaceae cyanobacterium]
MPGKPEPTELCDAEWEILASLIPQITKFPKFSDGNSGCSD